uniref:DNA-directed RNA polymerase subunit n=1 Tax=Cajanus cajan TaxID=3821 RepID=A0A151R2E6_CAJCA|nr:DNA-directed RNA polymerase subunit beta' [Cajanus cajan]
MIDQYKHQQLRIGSVSPQQISAWANKILPNGEIVGEVTKPYTFHYKTNKPEKDGLFCERIFGPIKSGICACGNYRVIGDKKEDPKFCEQCGVEFVDSRIRRYQMGYIKLACPVTHVWYLKRLPSYIANLLDKPLKELEGLVYCDVPVVKKPTFLRLRGSFEYEIQSWKYSIPLFFTTQGFDTFRNREISTGAGAIREQLADLDLRIIIDSSLVEWKELGEEGSTGNEWEDRKVGRRKNFLVRRMELAKHFLRTNIEPEWMVLCLLPVLPPELRPIIQIDGGKLMSSDINELYRRVIYRNNTLMDLLTTSRSTPGELVMCQEKLVQEAVDTLLDNGIRGQPMRDGHNKVYKSFADGFNADFDGDQMAVHVPLSLEAQAEARLLMFSHMNLLSPAIGDPISVPTQDMLIGLYVLTSGNRGELFFCNSYDAIGAYRQKRINFDSPLWLRIKKEMRCIYIRTTVGHISFYREIEEAIQGFCRAYSYGI